RSGIDPPGLPAALRALAVGGERGTMVADHLGAKECVRRARRYGSRRRRRARQRFSRRARLR
ncbi:hypothetical protein ABZS83_37110, partial [Streptomyces sp. NPDC005426]|uniref:hypothetical protein n=1 Tax=Streptomyces sp. NPDC005426 TaxID=3155344 RepID=UPI0033AD6DFD